MTDNDLRYVQILQQADSFVINKINLSLTSKGVKIAEFKPVAVPTSKPASTSPIVTLRGNYTL